MLCPWLFEPLLPVREYDLEECHFRLTFPAVAFVFVVVFLDAAVAVVAGAAVGSFPLPPPGGLNDHLLYSSVPKQEHWVAQQWSLAGRTTRISSSWLPQFGLAEGLDQDQAGHPVLGSLVERLLVSVLGVLTRTLVGLTKKYYWHSCEYDLANYHQMGEIVGDLLLELLW